MLLDEPVSEPLENESGPKRNAWKAHEFQKASCSVLVHVPLAVEAVLAGVGVAG